MCRCRQHELQRQRESSISEVRPVKEHSAILEHSGCYIFFLPTQQSVVMSVLEREEMDRQLDCAKTDLFAEQRRSREKLESMQDVLYFYLEV